VSSWGTVVLSFLKREATSFKGRPFTSTAPSIRPPAFPVSRLSSVVLPAPLGLINEGKVQQENLLVNE